MQTTLDVAEPCNLPPAFDVLCWTMHQAVLARQTIIGDFVARTDEVVQLLYAHPIGLHS